MDDKLEELIALNEMYFGKSTNLLKVEDLLTKFKHQYRKFKYKDMNTFRKMTKDPLLKKAGEAIADEFGFKEVAITISRTSMVNAYTIPFPVDSKGNSYDIENKKITNSQLRDAVIVTNDGFKFNKKKFPVNLLVVFTAGIIFEDFLDIPSLMGILMHEIGHNFSSVVMKPDFGTRPNENFADQFAAMYGYGPELANALGKINKDFTIDAIKDIPVINIINGLNTFFWGFWTHNAFEGHPTHHLRQKNVLEQMKRDLQDQKDLSPEMRKDLEERIKKCEDIMQQQFGFDPKDDLGTIMSKFYYKEVETHYPLEMEENYRSRFYSRPGILNNTIEQMKRRKNTNKWKMKY